MRRLLIILLLLSTALPSRAATPPSLRIWTANDRGVPDLLPGGRVAVVIELRSVDLHAVRLSHAAPAGLVLEVANPSSGSLAVFDMYPPGAPTSGILWTGEVSRTQMVNIALTYRVLPSAAAGDRTIRVSGQAGEVPLVSSTLIRVCCIPAPAAVWRVYLPMLRR